MSSYSDDDYLRLLAKYNDANRRLEAAEARADHFCKMYQAEAEKAVDAWVAKNDAEARAVEAEREVERLRTNAQQSAVAYVDSQKRAAARFGFDPGGLQWAWRQGERDDPSELEWAIVDALAMGCINAWPGDGVACAAQIASKQLELRKAAERQLAAAREAIEDALDDMGADGFCVCPAAKEQLIAALANTDPAP